MEIFLLWLSKMIMIKMRYNLGHLVDDLILAGTVVAGVTVGEVVKNKVPQANFPAVNYTLNGAELGGGALSIVVAPMIGKYHKYLAGFGSGLIADGLLPLEQAVNMQVATPIQNLGWAQNAETVGMRKTAEEYGWAQTQEEPKVVKAFSQEDLIKAYGWA